MRHGISMMASAVLTATLAAAPLTAGAAGTMDQMKDKAKATAKEAKTAITDSWITSKTKIALYADERVKGTQVSVATTDAVVHLRGKVDSEDAKAAAAELAASVEGVRSVKNDLQVVAPTSRKVVDATDKEIAKAVEGRLARDSQMKKVDVRTDAGVVILSGEVPSITESARASELARAVPGVRLVKNELELSQQ